MDVAAGFHRREIESSAVKRRVKSYRGGAAARQEYQVYCITRKTSGNNIKTTGGSYLGMQTAWFFKSWFIDLTAVEIQILFQLSLNSPFSGTLLHL